MNPPDILLLTVYFFCFLQFLSAVRSSIKNNLGWICVCSSIALLTWGLSHVDSSIASSIGLSLVGIFLFIPKSGYSIFQKLIYQCRYKAARNLISCLVWLHPFDGWLEQVKVSQILTLAQEEKLEKAHTLIKTQANESFYLQFLSFYLQADWENGLNWINRHIPFNILHRHSDLLIYYLRALGETGKLNKLLTTLDKTEGFLEGRGNPLQIYLVRMYALAFCGQVLQVRQLLQAPLKILPSSVQQFWLVTAQMVAGKKAYNYHNLSGLLIGEDVILKKAIDWRLDHPPIEPEKVLNKESYRILNRIKLEVDQEFYPRIFSFRKRRIAYATYLLLVINFLFFWLELKIDGSQNPDKLYQLGALVPEAVLAGQWWRLITANFLHFGWLHLLTNMTGLLVLGRFIEPAIGFFRYLIIYFFSGIGSMLIFTYLTLQSKQQGYILIGASAAIMGLLGALLVIFLKEWFQTKSKITARRLQLIIFTIGLQFTFDYLIPHISMLSHASGLVLGVVSSLILIGKLAK